MPAAPTSECRDGSARRPTRAGCRRPPEPSGVGIPANMRLGMWSRCHLSMQQTPPGRLRCEESVQLGREPRPSLTIPTETHGSNGCRDPCGSKVTHSAAYDCQAKGRRAPDVRVRCCPARRTRSGDRSACGTVKWVGRVADSVGAGPHRVLRVLREVRGGPRHAGGGAGAAGGTDFEVRERERTRPAPGAGGPAAGDALSCRRQWQ